MPRRRSRGSWTPRIIGIAVVLAAAAVAASVVLLSPAARPARPPRPLPGRVQSVQTAGLVSGGPPAAGKVPAAQQLLASSSGLAFSPVPAAELAAGNPQWTGNLMAGGTWIFIYARNGRCLASAGTRRAPSLALRRCDLGASQRWRAIGGEQVAGYVYYQFASLASGRCITVGPDDTAGRAAGLAACARGRPWTQLLALWWTS